MKIAVSKVGRSFLRCSLSKKVYGIELSQDSIQRGEYVEGVQFIDLQFHFLKIVEAREHNTIKKRIIS